MKDVLKRTISEAKAAISKVIDYAILRSIHILDRPFHYSSCPNTFLPSLYLLSLSPSLFIPPVTLHASPLPHHFLLSLFIHHLTPLPRSIFFPPFMHSSSFLFTLLLPPPSSPHYSPPPYTSSLFLSFLPYSPPPYNSCLLLSLLPAITVIPDPG